MLNIRKITGAEVAATVRNFTDVEVQSHRGDYYAAKSGEAIASPGVWLGEMSLSLGLADDVTVEQLRHILAGRHPMTGSHLARFRKDRVAAHLLTFSAPKSVSVLWALGAEAIREAVERSQEEAVANAMEFLEGTVPVVRRGDGGHIVETAAELLAVAFARHTGRRTAIQMRNDLPPDPQLHTHVLLLMARRHDDQIVAINSAALFRGGWREVEAYHAALVTELADLGFETWRTGRDRRYFEVKGVPGALCAEWSSRHTEIEKHWEGTEFDARDDRDPDDELGDCTIQPAAFWRASGAAHGVTAEDIEALRTGRALSPAPIAVGSARTD